MDLKAESVSRVERIVGDGPPDRRVVHCEATVEWYPELLRTVSEHDLKILARDADIVVFFDAQGNEIGWRDEGRRGADRPMVIDPATFLQVVVAELELPATARLANVAPRELPPVGWTHEGVVVVSPEVDPSAVLRVWLDPMKLGVIQCLAERAGEGAE